MKKKLSALEWEIMNQIWDMKSKVTVRDILEKAYPNGEKAYTTIQTVMNNLVEKGYLKREKIGLVNHYSPRKQKEKVVKKELHHIINKIFNGSPVALIQSLFGMEDLSREQIEELKNMIKNYNEEKKNE